MTPTAAVALRPLFEVILGRDMAIGVDFWDGSHLGPAEAPARVVVRSPDALRRILYSPNELGFARAYIWGEADIEGDIFAAARIMADAGPDDLRLGLKPLLSTARGAIQLRVLRRPLAPPS